MVISGRHRPRALPAIAVAALLLSGCGEDFDPPSLLKGPRILAMLAEPLEVGPGEEVSVGAFAYLPVGAVVRSERWSFCPLTTGARTGYGCILDACELPLDPDPGTGRVRANPSAAALACLQQPEAQAAQGEAGAPPEEVPETVEGLFRYRLEVEGERAQEAVLRVTLHTRGAPSPRNRPPRIEAFEVDGLALAPSMTVGPVEEEAGLDLLLRVDPESLDTFVDPAGRSRLEEPFVSWYATAGSFSDDRSRGLDARVRWTAAAPEGGPRLVSIYAVLRDGRGGQAALGPVEVEVAAPKAGP